MPATFVGIRQPTTKNHWQLEFELIPIFTPQTMKFTYNFKTKDIKLVVEQDLHTTTIQEEILELTMATGRRITIDLLDSNASVHQTLIFRDCILTNHFFDLDYAQNVAGAHILDFRYASVTINDRLANYTRAMGIVGRP